MILQWSQKAPIEGLSLEWRHKSPEFKLQWVGPTIISTELIRGQGPVTAVQIREFVEDKVAVITGPTGARGNDGEDGRDGDVLVTEGAILDAAYNWAPPSAQAIWVVSHNLNKYPSVTVVDSTGRLVIPEITYLSINLVQISFAFPTSGTAYLN